MSKASCAICHATYAGGERFCPLDGGAIVEEASDDPLIGKTIDGRYLVQRLIGRGGMGVVYEGHHVGLDKRIAIKLVIDVGKDALARFRREARAASRIADDHVVQIFDVGTTSDGREYLVMEYLDGRDLRTVLEQGPLPAPRALAIAAQILHGLHAIHEAGIVHRDIKPGNILLVGDDDSVKIMDFGISIMDLERADRVTQSGQVVGTPQFMAPEQLMGQAVDRRADLYAVGVTLHAMLTGKVPFTGTSVAEVAAQQLHGVPPALDADRDGVPEHVVRAVARALARAPEDRFATALDFADALGDVASPRGESMTERDRPASKRDGAATGKRDGAASGNDRPASQRDAPTSVERPRDAEPRGPSRGLTWLAAIGLVGLAAAVITYVLVRARSTTPPARGDAAVVVAEDPLAGAHRAEQEGNLELAIARYLERYESVRDPQLLFRIGELYERLDRTADAARYFQRYLDASPNAPDRHAVEGRVARLAPPPQVDAGAPAAVPDARAHDTAAHAPATPPIDPTCRCMPDDPRVGPSWLCNTTYPPLCHCEAISDHSALCPTPFEVCPEPCKNYSLQTSEATYICSDRDFANPHIRATPGSRCKGYSTSDIPPTSPEPVVRDGKYECSFCRHALADPEEVALRNYRMPGKAGDPCRGHDPATGQLLSGHMACRQRW